MQITLNDKSIELDDASVSLAQLFEKFKINSSNGIAVAVNEMIIPKKEWAAYSIHEKDKILVITATQGG